MSWHIAAYDLFSGNQRPQFPAPTIKLSKTAYYKNKIIFKERLVGLGQLHCINHHHKRKTTI